MRIRRLHRSDDMLALTRMIRRATSVFAEKGVPFLGNRQSIQDTIACCGRGEAWVVERDGGIVGTGVLSFPTQASVHEPELYRREGVATFHQLCAEPALRGRGASGLLLDFFEARAAERGATELACDVSEGATSLIAMYERRGYRFVGHADHRPHADARVVLARRADGVPYPADLHSERLLLRAVGIRDAPAIQEHFDNWNIIGRMSTSVPWPYPPDEARRSLEDHILPAHEARLEANWALCFREQPERLIGLISYRMSSPPGDRMFWLAEPYWGRGLMTEAVAATQDHLFFDLGVSSIRIATAVDNVPSHRVKEKTGAERTGPTRCAHHGGSDAAEEWIVMREAWSDLRTP
jgi:RimJ/RimL family protein N-acetyltransferase